MYRIGLLLVCFAIFAVVFGSCHHDCNNNGECVSGSCSCYDNWTGSDCSEREWYLCLIIDNFNDFYFFFI